MNLTFEAMELVGKFLKKRTVDRVSGYIEPGVSVQSLTGLVMEAIQKGQVGEVGEANKANLATDLRKR